MQYNNNKNKENKRKHLVPQEHLPSMVCKLKRKKLYKILKFWKKGKKNEVRCDTTICKIFSQVGSTFVQYPYEHYQKVISDALSSRRDGDKRSATAIHRHTL